MVMKEIWKDIPEYEGLYQVSSEGRVKSAERSVTRIDGKIKRFKSRILKQKIGTTNYMIATLSKNSKIKTYKVHQLVAIAFLSHVPCGYKKVVDHIDKNKLNNRVSNLRIISHRENCSRRSNGSSKYVGVSWSKQENKWMSCIQIQGKNKNLGYFNTELEAHNVYQQKLKAIECQN